jgi:hypothetical protein
MRFMADQHNLTDREVHLSARLLIAHYKTQAAAEAEQRIAEMKASGENAGAVAWARIREAAQELVSGRLKSS